ncbi:hypothetical protein AYO38_08350 [bacterium SCGC AG-212-C10]|nr:hypothetical protein AYO38_08350 [bacterium SCGC AG-212-C10]
MESMKIKRGKWRALLALTALAFSVFALVACGGGDDDEGSTATSGAGDSGTPKDGGTLVIGMSAANIPIPDTSPTEGYEGFRFVGFQLYDGLVDWDPKNGVDHVTEVKPALAESWTISDDHLTWSFKIRPGVTFHDGTPVDAAAIQFAYDRILNKDFQYYNTTVAAGIAGFGLTAGLKSYKATGDMAFDITTTAPDAFLLEKIAHVLIPSPTQVKKLGDKFVTQPVGSGPFMFKSLTAGQSMTMSKNPNYWGDKAHVDEVILRPMAEPSTRLAALRSGEVDWIETPPPEAKEALEKSGFQIFLKEYPHAWPWVLDFFTKEPNDPIANKLVRQAINYAIDRESLCKDLLNGVCQPAYAYVYPGHNWYGSDTKPYSYDPKKAKELLKEAGYPNGFKMTVITSASGSGQMWPPQMNDFLAQNLKAVGIDLTVQVQEWNSLITSYVSKDWNGAEANNISLAFMDPSQFVSPFQTQLSLGGYSNPELDKLFAQAAAEFDKPKQNAILQKAHSIVVDESPWIFIVHDLNLRSMAPYVKGFVPNQSWFADLTTIYLDK